MRFGAWLGAVSRTLLGAMKTPGPAAKVGIVVLGLIVAFAIAWVAVYFRERATQGPATQASSGMYAEGDAMLGVAVFGVLALIPLALAMFWLRPVAWFWSALVRFALFFAASGIFAVIISAAMKTSRNSWLFLAHARIGIMPLTALALLACACFAPKPRDRWTLLATGVCDGVLFAGILVVMFASNR